MTSDARSGSTTVTDSISDAVATVPHKYICKHTPLLDELCNCAHSICMCTEDVVQPSCCCMQGSVVGVEHTCFVLLKTARSMLDVLSSL